MDFKVAGTKEFVTALQLDTKLDGIPASVLGRRADPGRDARLHILDVMAEAIDGRTRCAPFAPRVITVKIPVDKIGEVIGPKGKMINQIQDETGAEITIEDDGTIYIGATDGPSAEAARAMINAIANPQMPEVGERFLGTVVKTTTFGAFVSLLPGQGRPAAHLQLRKLAGGKRVEKVEDVVTSARRSRSRSPRSTRAASSSLLAGRRGRRRRRRRRPRTCRRRRSTPERARWTSPLVRPGQPGSRPARCSGEDGGAHRAPYRPARRVCGSSPSPCRACAR